MHPIKHVVGPRGLRLGVVSCVVALSATTAALAAGSMVMRSSYNRSLGVTILDGPAKYTLYVFCVGTEQTRCTGGSSSSFSPLVARGRPVPASRSGIKAGKLSTRKLSGSRRQVTYYGQPVYLFKGDHKPGQTRGEERKNSNGVWLVVSTSGRPTPKPGY